MKVAPVARLNASAPHKQICPEYLPRIKARLEISGLPSDAHEENGAAQQKEAESDLRRDQLSIQPGAFTAADAALTAFERLRQVDSQGLERWLKPGRSPRQHRHQRQENKHAPVRRHRPCAKFVYGVEPTH